MGSYVLPFVGKKCMSIRKYFQIQTKYQIRALLLFQIQIQKIHEYVFELNPAFYTYDMSCIVFDMSVSPVCMYSTFRTVTHLS